MSYFCFYIYKAIRKVLFLPIFFLKGLIKVLSLVLSETSIIQKFASCSLHENNFI